MTNLRLDRASKNEYNRFYEFEASGIVILRMVS